MKKMAVLTSGGDAPGMNVCVRASVRTAPAREAEMAGVRRGYAGLFEMAFTMLDRRVVTNIIHSIAIRRWSWLSKVRRPITLPLSLAPRRRPMIILKEASDILFDGEEQGLQVTVGFLFVLESLKVSQKSLDPLIRDQGLNHGQVPGVHFASVMLSVTVLAMDHGVLHKIGDLVIIQHLLDGFAEFKMEADVKPLHRFMPPCLLPRA
jgi:hypothetical protein